MAQMKAHQVDGWLKRPDPAIAAVLVYGPDRGMVAERVRAFARNAVPDLDDPFSVVRLDAAELEADPGRLFDEAGTLPMFGGGRLIWISGAVAGRKLADAVTQVCGDPADGIKILIEAGDLKKGAALRSAVEGHARAMALPCYPDEGRSIDALIDETLQAADLAITLDARLALKGALGGDRLASRGELEKLVLYARGKTAVDLEDVAASVGDSAGLSMDDVVDSALAGRMDALDAAYSRHCRSGTKPFVLAAAAMRQFHALQIMRHEMETAGKSAAAVVAAQKPPVFFARKALVEKALAAWPLPAIERALQRLQGAVLQSRRRAALEEEAVGQALLAIAVEAAALARR